MHKCLLCGRKITDPKSVEAGYGPVCYRKKFGAIKVARKKRKVRDASNTLCYDIPGQISIADYLEAVSGQ